jgi:hypothetical protein
VSERLQVEVVRADELAVGDEAIIVEFRDKVTVARPCVNNPARTWIELASDEGAELMSHCSVLRVVRAPAEPTPVYEIERDRHGLMYSGPLEVGECVRVTPLPMNLAAEPTDAQRARIEQEVENEAVRRMQQCGRCPICGADS